MAIPTLSGTAAELTATERAALARAVLARAERRTGARSEAGQRPSATPRTSLLTSERPPLPVPPPLAALLPDGLRRGGTTVVTGSTSLLLELVAHACAGGAWAAAVGLPALGLLAGAQAGVALDRLALVPRPGLEAATVVAALIDGIDVVLVGPGAALVDADRRRLSARARDRGAVLLATTPWPGAGVVLDVAGGRWSGLDEGDGWLRTHEVRVVRSGRGSAGQVREVDLTLPLGAAVPQAVRDEDAGAVTTGAPDGQVAGRVAGLSPTEPDEATALLAPEEDLPAVATAASDAAEPDAAEPDAAASDAAMPDAAMLDAAVLDAAVPGLRLVG